MPVITGYLRYSKVTTYLQSSRKKSGEVLNYLDDPRDAKFASQLVKLIEFRRTGPMAQKVYGV